MAEALGLASGIIAVTQITGQVASNILKLKALWSEVKDTPKNIDMLLLKLEFLNELLSEAEKQYPQHQVIFQTDRLAILSIQYASQALKNLKALVRDLQDRISAKKKWERGLAKVKVVLKKDTLDGYQEQLNDNLQLLSLAQQTHLTVLSRTQIALYGSEIQARKSIEQKKPCCMGTSCHSGSAHSAPPVRQIPQSGSKLLGKPKLPWRNSGLFFQLLLDETQMSGSWGETGYCKLAQTLQSLLTVLIEESTVYQVRLHLPSWLSLQAWEIQAGLTLTGWKILSKLWITRPYDSDVFTYCRLGLTAQLLGALKEKRASIYDRDPRGWTLAHYAASKGQTVVLRELIELGLSCQEADATGITPLYHLCRAEDNPAKVLDIFRYLSSREDLDEAFDSVFLPNYRREKRSSLYRFIWRNTDLLDFVITNFHPSFYNAPVSRHFRTVCWDYVEPAALLESLTRNNAVCPAEFLAQIHDQADSSLHRLAKVYFQICLDNLDSQGALNDTNHAFTPWRTLLRWMFAGASPEDICRVGNHTWEIVTPLFTGLLACSPAVAGNDTGRCEPASRRLTAALRIWLEDLQSAGVCLRAYGSLEWSSWKRYYWLQTWRWHNLITPPAEDPEDNQDAPQLESITHGPKLDDWSFQWKLTGPEESFNDFWKSVEIKGTPLNRMPGEWVDD